MSVHEFRPKKSGPPEQGGLDYTVELYGGTGIKVRIYPADPSETPVDMPRFLDRFRESLFMAHEAHHEETGLAQDDLCALVMIWNSGQVSVTSSKKDEDFATPGNRRWLRRRLEDIYHILTAAYGTEIKATPQPLWERALQRVKATFKRRAKTE